MEPNVVGTTVAAPAREYLRFHLGGLAFLLALFTMTLPWLSFSYNCNETAGRQSAYELTTSHNVRLSGDIDTTAGTMRESRTIRIPAQWQIRLLIPLALVGLTLTLIRGRATAAASNPGSRTATSSITPDAISRTSSRERKSTSSRLNC